MIYYTLAPRFIFLEEWSHSPEKWACAYFTFCSLPIGLQFEPAKSGLVCQTYVSRFYCPRKPSDEYTPPVNPIEFEFNYTPWENRTPISPWGVPQTSSGQEVFAFGNSGRYSVEVNFLEEGGREIWRLNSSGKLFCQYFQTSWTCPKEFTYQGERKLSNLWEKYGDIGFPQLLWRYVFSYGEHYNLIPLPSLLALLPYKDDTNIYLFEYPNPKIAEVQLGKLLSIETVMEGEEDRMYEGMFLGHAFGQTILLNLFYRSLDFFGPYAFALPRGEGMWIATLSKKLADTKRIEKRMATELNWIYEVITLPIWEYKAKWYLGNVFQKEVDIPKMSSTSFFWLAYPYLPPTGEVGLYLYELDYLPKASGKEATLGEGIHLFSGRKLFFTPGSGKLPDPSTLLFFPPRDYPTSLNYADPSYRVYYLLTHPQIKHRHFTQCYSHIPPFPSAPLGQPSPSQLYNWHFTGNFVMLTWDAEGNWKVYDYTGVPISEDAIDTTLPPPNILQEKLGKPVEDAVFLSFLTRPEMPETIIFWFSPDDIYFPYIYYAYFAYLLGILQDYPYSTPYIAIPWEFCLNPQKPIPLVWGNLKMLVWRKGEGVVAEKDFGKYPIQFLFPAIDRQTGYVYLPILSDMEGDGSGKFELFVFKQNDWTPEVYQL